MTTENYFTVPFLLLFVLGYWYTGCSVCFRGFRARQQRLAGDARKALPDGDLNRAVVAANASSAIIACMATLHIRDLKDSVKESIRIRRRAWAFDGSRGARHSGAGRSNRSPKSTCISAFAARHQVRADGPRHPAREGLTGTHLSSSCVLLSTTMVHWTLRFPRGTSHREIPDFT